MTSSMRPADYLLCFVGIRLGTLYRDRPSLLSDELIETRTATPKARLKIGIATPVYNQKRYIAEAIRSVLDQDYPFISYVVRDGGSTDGTVDEIRATLGHYPSSSCRFVSEIDGGQAQAINLGLNSLDADVMGYLNGDDILLPGTLTMVANYFEKHPEADLVYGHRLLIDEQSRVVGRWIMPRHSDEVLRWRDYIPQETMFWRKSLWDRVGAHMDPSFQFALDWDLLVRFREAGARMHRIPALLGAFRVHDLQKSSRDLRTIGRAEIARIHARTLGYQPARWRTLLAVGPYLIRHACLNRVDQMRRALRALHKGGGGGDPPLRAR